MLVMDMNFKQLKEKWLDLLYGKEKCEFGERLHRQFHELYCRGCLNKNIQEVKNRKKKSELKKWLKP